MDGKQVALSMATSGVAPAMACLVTNPFDVCKTRLNMDRELTRDGPRIYKGVVDCLKQTFQAEGIRGVQRGLLFSLVRQLLSPKLVFIKTLTIGFHCSLYPLNHNIAHHFSRESTKNTFRIGLYEPLEGD